jgi:hypothetical protein
VSDTGVGIAEEDREIIFEKFRQSTPAAGNDTLTREYSGTGLGLSIVKELCILLGGNVSFVSELGKGSAFTVRLPWRMRQMPRGLLSGFPPDMEGVSPAKTGSPVIDVHGRQAVPVPPGPVAEETTPSR